MTAVAINDFATGIVLAGAIPALLFTLIYGLGSPWYRSGLGVVMFLLGVSLTTVYAIVLSRRFFGTYPGYEWVAVGGYSFLLVAMLGLVIITLIERRSSLTILSFSKGKAMADISTTPNTPDHLAPRAGFLDRTKKAIAGGLAGAVTAAGTAFTIAFRDGVLDGSDGWTIAGAVVGAFAIGFAAVYAAPANAV